MKHLRFDILDSTNSFLTQQLRSCPEEINDGLVVSCGFQGAGRGQAGNSWESAAGANALFSVALRQLQLPATEHFAITQWVALAMCDCLEKHLTNKKDFLRIKWPNDIYFQNKKLAGILIESLIQGRNIEDCVCGIGLNINQEEFFSDAPNPISLSQITGESFADIPAMIEDIAREILQLKNDFTEARLNRSTLQERYMKRLYRLGEWHRFQENDCVFEARILNVLPDGRLQLETKNEGCVRAFAFKEIKFVV